MTSVCMVTSHIAVSMQVMQELGLIGLRIQRMPSDPGVEFGIPSTYPYMTVKLTLCYSVVCYCLLYACPNPESESSHSLTLN